MGFFSDLFGGSAAAAVPKAPDYSPMIHSYNNIASTSAQNGADALKWAQGQVASNKGLTDQVNNNLLDTQTTYDAAGKRDLGTAQDLQSRGTAGIQSDIDRYRDPARKAADAGAAEAGVAQSFDAERQNHQRQLEGFGISPDVSRFNDPSLRIAEATGKAGAGTMAGRMDDQLATQANDRLLNQGNVERGQGTQATSVGNAAGSGAVSNNLANTSSGANVLGTDLAWTGAQTGAVGGATKVQDTGFQNQLDSAKATNASSTGLGSLLGAGLGAAQMFGYGEGGAVPDSPPGGDVPLSASPSRGAVTDDVAATGPGGAIRLNGGEFVIPRTVASWKGEEFFQRLIAKSKEDAAKAKAKPVTASTGPEPSQPQFQPRSQGAIPA